MGESRARCIGIRLVTGSNVAPSPASSRRDAAARRATVALRRWRRAARLDQADAAVELGCSVRQLREWESGRTCPPGWVVVLVMGGELERKAA